MAQTKLEWIKAQYTASQEKDISTFTSALNTQSLVSNPVPQGIVPKAITINEAFSIVPDAEAFEISETRTYDRLLDAFNHGRMDWVQDNIKTLIAGNKMTVATANALGALMAQTEPDPNWQAQVLLSPAQQAGFDVVYVDEVVEALNGW